MSRVGKKPIPLPKGVSFDIKGSKVTVKGPKGNLEKTIRPEIDLVMKDNELQVDVKDDSRQTNAFRGMTRSLIGNMVQGVSQGFERKLTIEGVGYKASVAQDELTLIVGYSNPVIFKLPKGISASVEKNDIMLQSIDKELLGQTAAKIRAVRKPEPYKGKGIRYADEYIVRKVGKAAGKK